MPLLAARLAFVVVACLALTARAEILVNDDSGAVVRLQRPAQRIVSLAPHVTENLFAIGAGDRIVATIDYSNYPEGAKRIRSIGSAERVDLEALVALKPDLVIAWGSGTPAAVVSKIKWLAIPVFLSQPNRIEDVARDLEQFGKLTGTEGAARAVADRFRQRLAELSARYSHRPRVRTFYEIWNQPLMTIGGHQIISDALQLCGGENVFAALPAMAAPVTAEAVIAADPEAIVASGMGDARPEWLDDWRRWTRLTAVKRNNLFYVPPELIQRHTPRILDGADLLCRHLEAVRARRP